MRNYRNYLIFVKFVCNNDTWCVQEMLVAAGDMGRDYEHCMELQKKVNDVEAVSVSVITESCEKVTSGKCAAYICSFVFKTL